MGVTRFQFSLIDFFLIIGQKLFIHILRSLKLQAVQRILKANKYIFQQVAVWIPVFYRFNSNCYRLNLQNNINNDNLIQAYRDKTTIPMLTALFFNENNGVI